MADPRAKWGAVPPENRAVYDALMARRTAYDTLSWQPPTLSLTAQAFLLTIALNPATTRFARALAALLGLLISLVTIQPMLKNRHQEMMDSIALQQFEEDFQLPQVHAQSTKGRIKEFQKVTKPEVHKKFQPSWVRRLPSTLLLTIGLAAFGLADLAVLVIAIWWPSLV